MHTMKISYNPAPHSPWTNEPSGTNMPLASSPLPLVDNSMTIRAYYVQSFACVFVHNKVDLASFVQTGTFFHLHKSC